MSENTSDDTDYYRCIFINDLGDKEWVEVIDGFGHDMLFELKQFRKKLRFFLRSHRRYFHYVSETIFEISGEIDGLADELAQLFLNSEKYRDADYSYGAYGEDAEEWSCSEYA